MSATIVLPNTNESHIAHILAKDKYAFKYISKDYILAEIGNLCDAAQKANANIRPIVGLDSKDKAGLLNTYEDLYRECREYNLALLSNRQIKLHQSVVKNAARAARLRDAEERFTLYSEELAKREAGDMMGLDAKGQKHRIASLKRKIARAEASLMKLQTNS
jgi:hypothetical protein